MGIKQLYNDYLRKLPNEYGDVSVMSFFLSFVRSFFLSSARAAELKFAVYEFLLICECVKRR